MLKNLFDRIINIGRPGYTIWYASWKVRCDVCGKFMAFKKKRGGMHNHCAKQYDAHFAEAERYREEQDEAYYHMLEVLDTFCGHYGCWGKIEGPEEFCFLHVDLPDEEDDYAPDVYEEEDDSVSSTEI